MLNHFKDQVAFICNDIPNILAADDTETRPNGDGWGNSNNSFFIGVSQGDGVGCEEPFDQHELETVLLLGFNGDGSGRGH